MLEIPAQVGNAAADQTAVDLQLRLAGASYPYGAARSRRHAAFLPRQVVPLPGQPRHHILQLGELNLKLGLPRLCTRGEYIEYQPAAIQNAPFDDTVQVPDLRRCEIIVEYHEVDILRLAQFGDRPGLSGSDIKRRMHGAANLDDPLYDFRAGGIGQQGEFIERLLHLGDPFVGRHHSDQQGAFAGFSGDFVHFMHFGRLLFQWLFPMGP